jgi:hypothetical protein
MDLEKRDEELSKRAETVFHSAEAILSGTGSQGESDLSKGLGHLYADGSKKTRKEFLNACLRKNPDLSFRQYLQESKEVNILPFSDNTFYTLRKKKEQSNPKKDCLITYLKNNPNSKYRQYLLEVEGKPYSRETFNQHKKIYGNWSYGKDRPKRGSYAKSSRKKLLISYIKNNSLSDYSQYKQEVEGKAYCDDIFNQYFKKIYKCRPGALPLVPVQSEKSVFVKTPGLYKTLWSCPAVNINESGRDSLKDFVETLNSKKQMRLEFIELKWPAVLEIRESFNHKKESV